MKRLALRQLSRSTPSTRSCALRLPAAPAFRVEYAVRDGSGDGVPPVVALHCSGSNHKQWAPLCDALKYHCVVAPNLFGSRRTTAWPPRGRAQTLDDSARLVEAALDDALGGAALPPIVVGHSHGAAVALRYAATRETSGVVVIEPNYYTLLAAATPFDGAADEAARGGGVDDFEVFFGRLYASAQTGWEGWGESFHRFWLAASEDEAWEDVPAQQRGQLEDSTIPHTSFEIASIDGAHGAPAARDLAALARMPGAKHLVLSALPGVGSVRALEGFRLVLARAGFEPSTLPVGGHLAPLTHPAETAAHLAGLIEDAA